MKFLYNETPIKEDSKLLENELLEFNRNKIENYGYSRFCYKYVDEFDSIFAGIDCQVGGGWLYIVSLWVERSERGKGLGAKLLCSAEQKGIEKGCHGAYLYTYSFQSPDFYEKYGYVTFGKLESFCGDEEKLFLKKGLA